MSDFQRVDPSASDDLRFYLLEIGARLADAFGCDDILWVEGPTEEQCFPLILRSVAKTPLFGTAIVSVSSTGDFDGKSKDKVREIYERLAKGVGLLPPAIGFVFDREERSDEQRKNLETQSSGHVTFLPRRTYESYLMDPGAIASVLNEDDSSRATKVTSAQVQEWLAAEEKRWLEGDEQTIKRKYWQREPEGGVAPSAWMNHAKLLSNLFNDLSETRLAYQKTRHSVALTKWVIANAPETLRELADFLVNQIEKGRRSREG